jgi:thioredoxin-related protein
MKHIIITLMVFVLPFAVVSCNQDSKPQKKNKTNLKQVIKSNTIYSSVNWISTEELDKKMAQSPKKVLILFTKKGCPYCKEMKESTLIDPEIIKLINDNFYAVMLDGKSKEPIVFRGQTYVNDHPNPEDAPWRHNLFAELVEPYKGGYYWPSTVFLNSDFSMIRSFPGVQKPPQFKRLLMSIIKS